MKKKGKRHYTPAELCMMAKRVKVADRSSYTTPYSLTACLYFFLLFKAIKWKPKKLSNYNQRVLENYYKAEEQPELLEEWNNELKKWKCHNYVEEYSVAKDCAGLKKGSFVYNMQKTLTEADNRTMHEACKYTIIHFHTMREKGITVKELILVRDLAADLINEMFLNNYAKFMSMREILLDEAGIEIEMPKVV